jgi:hypothetical protein
MLVAEVGKNDFSLGAGTVGVGRWFLLTDVDLVVMAEFNWCVVVCFRIDYSLWEFYSA